MIIENVFSGSIVNVDSVQETVTIIVESMAWTGESGGAGAFASISGQPTDNAALAAALAAAGGGSFGTIAGQPTDNAALAAALNNSISSADYVIEIKSGTIYARPRNNSGLTAYSGTDAYTVIQNAINALTVSGGGVGSAGGSLKINRGVYNLTNELVVNGWEGGASPYSQLTIFSDGFSTQIVQNTAGKNALIIKNQASVVLFGLNVYAGSSAKSALLLDDSGTSEVSTFKSVLANLYLRNASASYPAAYFKNFFDVNSDNLHVEAANNHALILENTSTTTKYGNSNFGFVRVAAGSTFAGLLIRSVNSSGNNYINQLHFNNLECIQGQYGIQTDYAYNCTFSHVDLEYMKYPISLGTYGAAGANETRGMRFLGGYVLAQGTGAVNITNALYTGGNTFNLNIDGAGIPISDAQQYRPGNKYDVFLGYSIDPTQISITDAKNTVLQYRTTNNPVTVLGRKSLNYIATTTDANQTAAAGVGIYVPSGVVTANRTVDMTALNTDGDYFELYNYETTYTISPTGAAVYLSDGSVLSAFPAQTAIIIRRVGGVLRVIN